MGLLSMASHLDNIPKQGLAFSDFILKYNFKICALLEKSDNNFFVTQSIGFDGDSIREAFSTSDFWQGICPQVNKLYNLSQKDKSNAPLLQLFSLNLQDLAKELCIYPISEKKILIVFNSQISDQAIKDSALIDSQKHKCDIASLNTFFKESSVLEMFQINLIEAVDSFAFASKLQKENKAFIKEAIYNELYNRFICIYNNKDATASFENGIINTVFIMDRAYSTELIINHLILNFREVLGSYADLAKINNLGKAKTFKDIADFLQAD